MSRIAKNRVYVAMSGGVDSSVAAYLLIKEGYDVFGVFMKNWHDCDFLEEQRSAERAAYALGIPFAVWDFSKEYKDKVLTNFYSEYKDGKTPNPDVLCNKEIKFGVFFKKALEEGADFIATGHHVRKLKINLRPELRSRESEKLKINLRPELRSRESENLKVEYALAKARDTNKDQSYFLWTLKREVLPYIHFPIGEFTKAEVRKIAKKVGLPNHNKKDSQGLCFIGKIKLPQFLEKEVPRREGSIVNESGVILGKHSGIAYYTDGQREGLELGGMKEPHFVAYRDTTTNTLIVAPKSSSLLYSKTLYVSDINWIGKEHLGEMGIKIRYRQEDQNAVLEKMDNRYALHFEKPQYAPAIGQSAVFYKDEKLLGGGIVTEVEKDKEAINQAIECVS